MGRFDVQGSFKMFACGQNKTRYRSYWTDIDDQYSAWNYVIGTTTLYKITEIVCALWLTERSVCMRVCKHGFDMRCFAFRANHASTNSERVLVIKTRQVYFIYSFLRRLKLGKSFQRSWVNFFRLSWHFKRENPYFGQFLFAKQELITRARLRVQDFATGKNLSFNQCHNNQPLVFISRYANTENVFYCLNTELMTVNQRVLTTIVCRRPWTQYA